MAQQAVDFDPSTGDDTSGALRKLDNNIKDHETRLVAVKATADAAATKTYVDQQDASAKTYVDTQLATKLPVANPTYTGMLQKTGIVNEYCYRVTNTAGQQGIGGAFGDWSLSLTPALQVDSMAPQSHYMGVRWTQWGVRHLAAIYAYAGGTTSSMVSIGFHFDVGPNKHVFYSNGSAVFAGALTQNSDYRIKDDIVEIDPEVAAAALRRSRPIEYRDNRQSQDSPRLAGFVAHEFQECFPLLVQGEKDAVQESIEWQGDTTPYPPGEEPDGWVPPVAVPVEVPVLQNVNYAGEVPYLTAGWQQHDRRIKDLEAKLQAALERIAALEAT